MRTILLFISLFFLLTDSFGTPQKRDSIKIDGKTYILASELLKEYFEVNPNKKPKVKYFLSNLDKGYYAEFSIRENQLFINDIKIASKKNYRSLINRSFPKNNTRKLDWFDGLICLQLNSGKEVVNSFQIKYLILEFKQGNFIKSRQIDYAEMDSFGEKQFQEFKRTKDYENLFLKLESDNKRVYRTDSLIKWNIGYYSKILY